MHRQPSVGVVAQGSGALPTAFPDVADNLPYVFLWYPEEIDVVNANLQGVSDLNLRDNMHYVNEWWIKK